MKFANAEIRRHSPRAPWTYADLDRRQREVAARVLDGGDGALLLSEVAPVITMGRRAGAEELRMSPELLELNGIEVLPSERGGLATYHGPGQWVLFAVDRLERLTGDRRGVRKAVTTLLEIACETARSWGADASLREGCELGVWTPRGKIAAVGVQIQDGILLHGLALNGFRTRTSFMGLRPCGLDAPVDFLLKEGDETGFEALGTRMAEIAQDRFWPVDGRRG